MGPAGAILTAGDKPTGGVGKGITTLWWVRGGTDSVDRTDVIEPSLRPGQTLD